MDRKRKQEGKNEEESSTKMLTMLIVSTMIVGSVPVSAQTVSENEWAAIEVTEVTPEETTDAPESEAKLPESEADNIGQAEETELPAEKEEDEEESKREEIKNGNINGFSYSVYEETDENGNIIRYAEIAGYEEQDDKKITIPDQVTVDGEAVPVTSIGDSAFSSCSGITSITIPEVVTSIEPGAFSECSGLEAITIPEGVTSIGDSAFKGCGGLKAITVAEGNTVYDSRNNCNAIIEKETNTLIAGCQNTVIPESVTSIEEYAFSGCSGLTRITIPTGVTSIGKLAFSDCGGLTEVMIPENVTSIGDSVFSGCSGLTKITVVEGNKIYDSRNNCNAVIEKETNTLIVGCQNTVIPESVTSIEEYAFSGCSGLTEVTIPTGVTSIGDGAFSGCKGLTSVSIPEGVTIIGVSVFSGCSGLTSVSIPKSVTVIGMYAFSGCSGLTSVSIPEGVISMGMYAFSGCKSLTSVSIPESMTSIGIQAFSSCSNLISVSIPRSVISIGSGAFSYCKKISDIYYEGSEEEWHKIEIGDDAFTYYDEEDEEYYNINYTLHCNGTGSVPGASQAPAPSVQPTTTPTPSPSVQPTTTPTPLPSAQPTAAPSQTPSAQQAEVPAPGTKLEASGRAFQVAEAGDGKKDSKPEVIFTNLSKKDKKAKKVAIPKTVKIGNVEYQVTAIAPKALKNSKKLQSIVIPDTITEIGEGSFEGCTALKSITIGKNVTTIGKNAFKNCKNLKKITVKSKKLKKVGKSVLSGVHKKCVIKVPKKKLTAYKKLFKGKGQKKTVKITK